MSARILVVDDDRALSEMLGMVLQGEGFETVFAADGPSAVEKFGESRPDLVLLDLMLPGMSGLDVCRTVRGESGVPIIMLTAKGEPTDVVHGLESGADDYIVKPFNPKELVARIRTRLRPAAQPLNETLRIGDLTVDVAAHEVRRHDEPIALTLDDDTGELLVDGSIEGTYTGTGENLTFTRGKVEGTAKLRHQGESRSLSIEQIAKVLGLSGKGSATCSGDNLTLTVGKTTVEMVRDR